MGNAFLSLTDPKRIEKMADKMRKESLSGKNLIAPNNALVAPDASDFQNDLVQTSVQDSYSEAMPETTFGQKASMEKIAYLTKRITRLEELLLKINNSQFLVQKLNGTNLSQKITEFETFRQNTKLEVAALKQRLDKIAPVKKKPKLNIPEISDKKLHDLVFRSK